MRRIPFFSAFSGVLGLSAALASGACSPASVAEAPVTDAASASDANGAFDAVGAGDAGDAGDPGAGGDAGLTPARVCSDVAYARCTRFKDCTPTVIQLRFGDFPTCQAITKAACLENLASPSTGASAATLEACAQAIPSWTCSDYIYTQNPPPACAVQAGARPGGARCGVPSQCQSGFCAVPPGSPCGVCVAPPGVGDSCAELTNCGVTLTCAQVTLKCALFSQLGGPCKAGQPCTNGLTCVGANASSGTAGTCQPTAEKLGDPCSFLGAGCDLFAGLSCNAQSQTCATAQFVGAGTACGLVANQMAYCAGSGDCTGGVCVAAPGLGDACDVASGPACINQTRCVVAADGGTRGTCRVPGGATCL